MQRFKDNKAREWIVSVDIAGVKRVREAMKIDLLTAVDGKLFQQLSEDPILLVDLIYVLCKAQAEEKSITDEDFGAAMAGDAIDSAATALTESLINFFRESQRGPLRKMLRKIDEAQRLAKDKTEEAIDGLDVKKIVDEEMKKSEEPKDVGDTSGGAPESSDSTPAPSPSES